MLEERVGQLEGQSARLSTSVAELKKKCEAVEAAAQASKAEATAS